MDINLAWNSIVGQLQSEMSKTSFDSFVQDTQVVGYQDGILSIGVQNSYARDWLESRLESTVSRLLVGVLNRSVDVQFVLLAKDNPIEEDETDEEVTIEGVQELDYDSIVKPERQVVFPAYIFRLIPEIGAEGVLSYISFKQTFYSLGERERTGVTKSYRVNMANLLSFSAISRTTFWRLLKRIDISGLIECTDLPNAKRTYHRNKCGALHLAPKNWKVFLTPRLARPDIVAVMSALQSGLDQGLDMEQALKSLISLENIRDNLLPSLDTSIPKIIVPDAIHTVMNIVQHLIHLEKLPPALNKLAQDLHRKIINSMGTVHVTHYFLRQLAPSLNLTPEQVIFVMFARDKAYINAQTGERRENIAFLGGYQEMANLVGIKTPKQIQAWFHPTWKAARGGDMTIFMTEFEAESTLASIDYRAATAPRHYQVMLDEPLDSFETKQLDSFETDSQILLKQSLDSFETNNQIHLKQSADSNETTIKSLKPQKTTKKIITTTTDLATPAPDKRKVVGLKNWDINQLCKINHIHPRMQKALAGSQSNALVSWILWASSPAGNGLDNPVNYALSQLKSYPNTNGAGGDFDIFAHLSPAELLSLIEATPTTAFEGFSKCLQPCSSKHLDTWLEVMVGKIGYSEKIPNIRTILFAQV